MSEDDAFFVSSYSCVFDKRRGATRVLNVWTTKERLTYPPDVQVNVSPTGRLRVFVSGVELKPKARRSGRKA